MIEQIMKGIFYLYIIIYPFQYLTNKVSYNSIYMILIFLGYFSFLLLICFKKISKKFYILLFILFLLSGINYYFNTNLELHNIVVYISYQCMAISLFYLEDVSYIKIRLIYYSVGSFFIYHWFRGNVPESIIYNSSHNAISALMLFLLMILVISLNKRNEKINFLDILIFLITSIYGVGRAGILVGVILLIYQILSYSIEKIILIFSIVVSFISSSIFSVFQDKLKYFESHKLESVRTLIWKTYMGESFLKLKYFLFGVPYTTHHIFMYYKGNLHNSFFNFHAKFGLFSLLIVFFLIFKCYIFYFKEKNFYMIVMMTVLVIRISLDQLAFYGSYDIICFYFIYATIIKIKKNNKNL